MTVWVAEYVYQTYSDYSYHRIGIFASKERAKEAAQREDYFPSRQSWTEFQSKTYVAFDLGRATIQVYEVPVE